MTIIKNKVRKVKDARTGIIFNSLYRREVIYIEERPRIYNKRINKLIDATKNLEPPNGKKLLQIAIFLQKL